MDGLLLVDKPKGWTSFDVVARIRGILVRTTRETHISRGFCIDVKQGLSGKNSCRCKLKVGHTGTLDPMATGLLVLCIGSYTKKVPNMIKHDKTYDAEITLGATSTTGDAEGDITSSQSLAKPTENEVQQALNSFIGEYMQMPPAFSALKVNGKRAYDLARNGEAVKLEPRKVTILGIELIEYNWPVLRVVCSVGSGTYIRSLAEDIGVKLKTGAYLSALRRTRVDIYDVRDAVSPEVCTTEFIKQRLRSRPD